ncbi:hypothetical protein RhiirA4_465689 [Rhizophagus irregularis]|uniref:Uncharacterized protein n=1 Tax=Rhizophagus irregularis TaxID=588596 RepID=A0A2I1GSJ9_9GLOM|nr:hypothetical protein RhiirA4_465689 [Rhizophagus irregularis]
MAVNTQHTPRSTPALPILHWTFTPKCILKVTYQAAITISSIPKNHRLRDNLRHIISNLPKNIEILKHNHFHYRLLSYNDYLIQVIRNQLWFAEWFAARHLNNFAHLEYFTDGSFNAEPSSPEFQMGYGWTTSNLQEFNWTHNGAVEYMPSSTKGHFDCFNRVSL